MSGGGRGGWGDEVALTADDAEAGHAEDERAPDLGEHGDPGEGIDVAARQRVAQHAPVGQEVRRGHADGDGEPGGRGGERGERV